MYTQQLLFFLLSFLSCSKSMMTSSAILCLAVSVIVKLTKPEYVTKSISYVMTLS